MKRKLAHVLRRAARVLIGWSTKLEPPSIYTFCDEVTVTRG
ncbi:hypothetical protein [Mycolicibacterium peregrinum]